MCLRMEKKAIEKLILMERLNELNRHRLPIIDKKIELSKTLKTLFSIYLISSSVSDTQLMFNNTC